MLDLVILPSPLAMQFALDEIGDELRTFRTPLERSVREVLRPSIQQNFEEGGRPPWELLADSTIIAREYEGTGTDPLIRTGKLMTSATALSRWSYTQEEATFGPLPVSVAYGEVQHFGSNSSGFGGSTVIPSRPWADVQESDLDNIEGVFFEWVREKVAVRGFTDAFE